MTNNEQTRSEINSILEDISDLKQVENNIEQAVWVQDLSTDRIIYVSPAFKSLWGRSPEDLYTDPTILIESVHPEDRVQVLTAKPHKESDPVNLTYRILQPDGNLRWIFTRSFIIHIPNRESNYLFCIAQDITDQKQVEHALGDTVDRIREQFRLSHKMSLSRKPGDVLKILMSAQGLRSAQRSALLFFNNADLGPIHGVELTAFWQSGKPLSLWESETDLYEDPAFLELLHPRQTLMISDINSDSRLTPQMLEILRENNITSLVIFPLSVLGKWLGVLIIYFEQEININHTELRNLKVLINQLTITIFNLKLLDDEEKSRQIAERANEIKTEFLAMISHELRTPLTSIIGFTTTLMAENITWNQNEQRDFIQTIHQETVRLQELIDHLLDLSRLDVGMLPVLKKPVSLEKIFQDSDTQLQTLTDKHLLSIDLPDQLPHVNVDVKRIVQVLVNLVKNASAYAPEDTEINIKAFVRGKFVQINVIDTGPGIPLDERKNAFKAFTRGKDKENGFPTGAGLGLAICKGLVEAHGGRIWIRNTNSPGTTIAFTVPLITVPSPVSDANTER
ncbi:MAG: PAS domain-containing protein [Brevefilum sp.]|nr:PAS domain-containing protein [Brevefilum sp.]